MKKAFIILSLGLISLSACISKKKYKSALEEGAKTKMDLATLESKLDNCDQKQLLNEVKIKSLEDQVKLLKENNSSLLTSVGDLTLLTTKGAENIEKSLESLKEKDLRIKNLSDAVTKKDSAIIAMVTSIKGVLGNMEDEDIQVNVEKGVVFISISDKLLFTSGSYAITPRAKEILGKVAKVVNNKPEFEVMVEGHTDDVPVSDKTIIVDNWDLSVKRATSVVRVLQNDFKVAPERMTAAGKSAYAPLESNATPAGKAKNRRTRIILLPKIDQFYNMLETESAQQKK
jgi:chemotaxis protein MotB